MGKVTEFYEAFSKDEAMRKRANEAIVAFAKREGYSFTEEDLQAVSGGVSTLPVF
jgi:hypothetical protein